MHSPALPLSNYPNWRGRKSENKENRSRGMIELFAREASSIDNPTAHIKFPKRLP